MQEEWKPIAGSKGYEVSNFGRVRRKRGHLYKELQGYINNGYRVFAITPNNGGKQQTVLGHRLVAEAFLPHTDKNWSVRHIDGNNSNNKVSNLEWIDVPDARRRYYR